MAINETLHKPQNATQLGLWTRVERNERETTRKESQMKDMLEFIAKWNSLKPNTKLKPQEIAESLGFSKWTARRRIRELIVREPQVIVFLDKRYSHRIS